VVSVPCGKFLMVRSAGSRAVSLSTALPVLPIYGAEPRNTPRIVVKQQQETKVSGQSCYSMLSLYAGTDDPLDKILLEGKE
jgi:hypothetical protein